MRRQQFQNTTMVMLGIIIVLLVTISPAARHTITVLTDDAVLGILWLGYTLSEPFKWLTFIGLFAIVGLATYACAVAPWKDDMKGAAATKAPATPPTGHRKRRPRLSAQHPVAAVWPGDRDIWPARRSTLARLDKRRSCRRRDAPRRRNGRYRHRACRAFRRRGP